MGIMKITIVVLLAIVVISITFQYLIATNKIKISKISKIFYDDDKNFIKSWKKTQEKGMLKYIIKNIIYMTAMMGIMGIVFKLNKLSMYGYEQSQTLFVALSVGVILGLINSLIGWGITQDRYNRLKEKENLESDNLNNNNKKFKA